MKVLALLLLLTGVAPGRAAPPEEVPDAGLIPSAPPIFWNVEKP
ncbi:hypothetical protein [Falsiroseomonas frigidaquae]|nr:hypothetical protein [Falsiroseomonas frigidaquae]